MPANFAYYDNPEAGAFDAIKMYVFHKAYEDVNYFPKFPTYSFLLVKNEQVSKHCFVVFRIIKPAPKALKPGKK